MTVYRAVPTRFLSDFLRRAGSDSLVRNSLYLMASTVITAGLGYVFWAIAAHAFTRQEVGIGSAIISLCGTMAMLTYLGSSAMLIERLPGSECSSAWTTILVRACLATALVTAVATALAVPVLMTSTNYRIFFNSPSPIIIAIIGSAAWTLFSLLVTAFVSARRAGRYLSICTLVSAAKVLFVLPFAAVGAGAMGVVGAWVASTALGVGVGALWLVPRMGLGRRPGGRRRREAVKSDRIARSDRRASHRRSSVVVPSTASMRRLLGQHLTSTGGALTPLVLPLLVVLRLGVELNAYFYITWMVGAVFFMVSPSVATAVFAEGVRADADLHRAVVKALLVSFVLLAPAIMIMIIGGKLVLGLFGAPYAAAGYGLLILLAISALPDAVSNVAISIFRVTERLTYSTLLNLGIFGTTVLGAWFLMPSLGIAGVGVAWLGAQTLGAIASLPAYTHIRRPVTA
jgi:O-antigen/teichoic acid export membrane protein